MGRHVPFTVNLTTLIFFVPSGALGIWIWIKIIMLLEYLPLFKTIKNLITFLIVLYILMTYKYFVIFTVHLIMYVGLVFGDLAGVGKAKTDEIYEKYTFDSFTWNPLMLWKCFFWRPKTVDELAKDKINKEKEDEYKRNKEKAKLQKEKELQDAVDARVEELKAKNH